LAKLFLDPNEKYVVINDNVRIFGTVGNEQIVIKDDAENIVIDSNVEEVDFAGNVSDFKFQQKGNQLFVFDSQGKQIAQIGIQADGTDMAFADETAKVVLDRSTHKMLLGEAVIPQDSPGMATEPKHNDNNGLGELPGLDAYEVQSLWSGYKWNSNIITYSFNSSIPEEYKSDPEFTENWQPFNEKDKEIVREIFDKLSKIISVEFAEVDEGGDIRFNKADMIDKNGFAEYPYSSDDPISGDVWISNNYDEEGNEPGTYGYLTLLHEIGHALGLKHPFEGEHILSQNDDHVHTVMSYTPKQYIVVDFSLVNEGSQPYCNAQYLPIAYPDNYQLYDIMALQAIYGANTNQNSNNNVYDVSNLYYDHKYMVIWDAGGNDTIDASKTKYSDSIDLRNGQFSSIDVHTLEDQENEALDYYKSQNVPVYSIEDWVDSVLNNSEVDGMIYTGDNNLAIAKGVIIENVITGSGNDTVIDNKYDNKIITNGGNDAIYIKEGGFDIVDGGEGYDILTVNDNYAEDNLKEMEDGSWLLNGNDFTVMLSNVEEIHFADREVMLPGDFEL